MTATSAPNATRRPCLPEHPFQLMRKILCYASVAVAIFFLLRLIPTDLGLFILYTLVGHGLAFSMNYKSIFFIVFRRPFEIGDLIEKDPSGDRLERKNTWRVKDITLFDTHVESLHGGASAWWLNGRLADKRLVNWSRVQANFQIKLGIPVNTRDGLLFLQKMHEKIEQYANDNPGEWLPVDTATDCSIVIGKEYAEDFIEIRHREKWHALETVMESGRKLVNFCREQARNFNDIKPKRASGLTLSVAAGDNDEGVGDDKSEEETTMNEEDAQEQGGVEEGGNATDDPCSIGMNGRVNCAEQTLERINMTIVTSPTVHQEWHCPKRM